MELKLPYAYQISSEVARALEFKQPIVALESTVITHGLPYPENRILAEDMESEIRSQDVVPATVAVVGGRVYIGAGGAQIEQLAQGRDVHKVSSRDLAAAITKGWNGGTTVAATMVAANIAGIQVFATGGIGGVHRSVGRRRPSYDISADLPQLARTPIILVCAGAKAILDLPATIEYLETFGVPVVGYKTDEFPAFYARSSGLNNSVRADSPGEIASLAKSHWDQGLQSAILVVNPPPENVALPADIVKEAVRQALEEAQEQKIRGQEVTPFLLGRVSELTGGASMQANLGLLRSNARLAAEIARQMVVGKRKMV